MRFPREVVGWDQRFPVFRVPRLIVTGLMVAATSGCSRSGSSRCSAIADCDLHLRQCWPLGPQALGPAHITTAHTRQRSDRMHERRSGGYGFAGAQARTSPSLRPDRAVAMRQTTSPTACGADRTRRTQCCAHPNSVPAARRQLRSSAAPVTGTPHRCTQHIDESVNGYDQRRRWCRRRTGRSKLRMREVCSAARKPAQHRGSRGHSSDALVFVMSRCQMTERLQFTRRRCNWLVRECGCSTTANSSGSGEVLCDVYVMCSTSTRHSYAYVPASARWW